MSFDTKLATIRGFNNYLNLIIQKGHGNSFNTIDSLYNFIKNYYENRVDPLSNVFDSDAFMNDENKKISTYESLTEMDYIYADSDPGEDIELLSESQSEAESELESVSGDEKDKKGYDDLDESLSSVIKIPKKKTGCYALDEDGILCEIKSPDSPPNLSYFRQYKQEEIKLESETEKIKYDNFINMSNKIDVINIYKESESNIKRLDTFMDFMWEY